MKSKFLVEISDAAKRNLGQNYDYIAKDKKTAASKWYRSFRKIAKSLSLLPLRYELIPEIGKGCHGKKRNG